MFDPRPNTRVLATWAGGGMASGAKVTGSRVKHRQRESLVRQKGIFTDFDFVLYQDMITGNCAVSRVREVYRYC